MKSDKLFDAIGEARGEYVQDAEAVPAAKRYSWVKWAAVAACVLIAVLIAVPALNGKAPEVEPQPTEPAPVETPVDTPVDEPSDKPETEPVQLKDREAVAAEYFANGGNAGGGTGAEATEFAFMTYTYEDYLNDYAAIRENPVFAALFDDPQTQQFDVVSIGLPTKNANYENVDMVVDGFTKRDEDGTYLPFDHYVCIQHYESDALGETHESALVGTTTPLGEDTEQAFTQAESLDIRTDYRVDGVEVQKYSQNDFWRASDSPMHQEGSDENTFWERIIVDGDWYVVYGDLEADVDTIASVIARIVSQQ